MSRILLGMAALNSLLLLLSFAVGFLCEGRAAVRPELPLTAAQRVFAVHLFAGLGATLLTLLLHSVVFTYFIGTGRWVQEVVKAYGLPETLWDRSRRLKMQALPFVLISIVLVIATATLGAATDRDLLSSNLHLAVAILAVAFNGWSYLREYQVVVANGELITQIMSQVKRMRRERGLDEPELAAPAAHETLRRAETAESPGPVR